MPLLGLTLVNVDSLTLVWSNKTAQHGPGKLIVSSVCCVPMQSSDLTSGKCALHMRSGKGYYRQS